MAQLTHKDVEDFCTEIQKKVPNFELRYKTDSWLQRCIGQFLRPVNDAYMVSFTSTFYPYVYFPNKAYYEKSALNAFVILAHEYIHLLDTKKRPVLFRLGYIFPQVLSLVFLVLFFVTCKMTTTKSLIHLVGICLGPVLGWSIGRVRRVGSKWYDILSLVVCSLVLIVLFGLSLYISSVLASVLFCLFLLCLAPWPAPFRVYYEQRGYAMSTAVKYWLTGSTSDYIKYFTGPDYYYMLHYKFSGQSYLDWYMSLLNELRLGTLKEQDGYKEVFNFLKNRSLLRESALWGLMVSVCCAPDARLKRYSWKQHRDTLTT